MAILGGGPRTERLVASIQNTVPVTVVEHSRVLGVVGFSAVTGITIRAPTGSPETIACDGVVIASTRRPAIELAQQASARLIERAGVLVPQTDADGRCAPRVFACGDLRAPGTIDEAVASGDRAGRAAAAVVVGEAPRVPTP